MILQPGIHLNVPTADYFADCAPEPSLTQSVAKTLIDQSPLHAWYQHPRLNPDFRRNEETRFDIGNIAHSIMLGRGKDIVVLDGFDDWRKKAAQEAREEALAAGKLAVLGKHYQRASKMVEAAREQLDMRGVGAFFRRGHGEVVSVWEEDGIWLRQMIDWYVPDDNIFVDYKTTDFSVAPHSIDRMMCNAGWSIQAAMAERGLDALDPNNAGRRKFFFVVQEATVPYQLTVVQLTRGPMVMGHKQLDRAVALWRECMATGIWPGYALDIVQPEWPGWMEQQWLTREITDAARERQPREVLESLMGG